MYRVLYLLNRTCICTQALANSNNNIIIFLTNGHHFSFSYKKPNEMPIYICLFGHENNGAR